ncbi:hypothetical protein PU02_0239 [Bartonella ancashensis]|uniref:Uncharacterized protein n=1 Tax=Bartonella ancashensis TaxID=1318743 RepID=A0A0M5KZ23_9HYPH|nr:hypothetical protein PU02_0239 [Bartonella ancashensis]
MNARISWCVFLKREYFCFFIEFLEILEQKSKVSAIKKSDLYDRQENV